MTVCAASAEEGPINNGRRKRQSRILTELEWGAIRRKYETTSLSHRALAEEVGISYSTLSKRSMREKWSQSASLVARARDDLAAKTEEALSAATTKAADLVAKQLVDELQPWITEQKTAQIKRAIERSTRAQQRLDKVALGYDTVTKDGDLVTLAPGPKEEAFLAQSEDKYDNIIRRNLGMADNNASSGNLNVQILAGQAAVQISQS